MSKKIDCKVVRKYLILPLVLLFMISCASARWAQYEEQVFQTISDPNVSEAEKTVTFTEYIINLRNTYPEKYMNLLKNIVTLVLENPEYTKEQKEAFLQFYQLELQNYHNMRFAQEQYKQQQLLNIIGIYNQMRALDLYQQRTLMWK